MEAFYRTHNYLVEHTNAPVRRDLMDEIDWNARLIGIKGTRGVGKTTFLLQYAKEKFGYDRSCLFVNMNNFYFSQYSLVNFAGEFVKRGGKVLLIDQVFKLPQWSHDLRTCYERYPNLKIVFTGSSVMRLKEENPELNGIVQSYNLRGFSFEVDILLIKQIELKYLSRIKKLLYLLAVDGPVAPNISQLASDIQTSRATVMNYIKYLADARLINMVYPKGEVFPKKPAKIMMHNTNLMYSIYPVKVEEQDVLETFFVNSLWKDHKVNKGEKGTSFLVDGNLNFRICGEGYKIKSNPGVYYAMHRTELGHGNQIPLWLFGFLY